MASTLVDLTKINITSTGTGALTLGSAATGYRGVEALTNGRSYSYSIQQGANWEIGRGTYLADSQQMTRSVMFSSRGGSAIKLAGGAQVAFTALAEDLDNNNLFYLEQAQQAAAQADVAATAAEAIVGPSYASTAAGIADTLNGQSFAVDNGDGTVTIYRNNAGSAELQRNLATVAYFNGTAGASRVGLSTGESTEAAVQAIKQAPLSIATVCVRGSTPDVSAANKTAVQDLLAVAASTGRAIYIPNGDWYIDGGISCLTGLVSIICDGRVLTNTTTAWLTLKTPATSGEVHDWFIRGGTFINTNGTQAQKSSSIIKFQSAGALILYPEFRDVKGYGFYQMFDDDAGTYTTPFGNESRMNHGIVAGCVPNYYGALNAKYCLLRRTGSGTGWSYEACRDNLAVGVSPTGTDPVGTELLGYPAYLRIAAGGVNAVCGDITISGHFSGLQVGAVSIDGACSYRAQISLTPHSQIDAQAKRGIFFDPLPTTPNINMRSAPQNVGGDIDIAKDSFRTAGHKFEAQGYGESTGGTYLESLPIGAQSIPLCSVQIQADYSCVVELEVGGIVQGVAPGVRRKAFTIKHNGSTVTATEQTAVGFTDPASPASGFFNFTATVVSDTVTFVVTLTPTAVNSKLTAQYRVTSGPVLVTRL